MPFGRCPPVAPRFSCLFVQQSRFRVSPRYRAGEYLYFLLCFFFYFFPL
jgi:hypothetical protein